ncbi:hypothetical protein JYT29_01665, partial [Nitrospina gracilis]|nr:hypothetical protein [Nitrospina gracilis]
LSLIKIRYLISDCMVSSVQNSNLPLYSFAKIIVFAGLTSAYLSTRLPGLTVFPIFTDEAMYIHIAQIIDSNWDNLFLGKVNAFKPFFLWFLALYQNIFPDPVLAGRLASVTMGLGSMFGGLFSRPRSFL